jgi:hypothetical protein
MENLLLILLILGVSLFLIVTVLERIGNPINEEKQAALSRWILPLCALLVIVQLIRYWMG